MNVIINAVIKWIWEHKLASLLIVLALIAVIYHFGVRNRLAGEAEREREARSQEHQERIEEAKEEVNRASENINAVKNANYSNLNNDELRNRIINAARRQK